LFANFELHCDSYTFSLRLNLKQLKLEKNTNSQFIKMNEHAKEYLSKISFELFYQTEAKQSKA